MITAVKRKRKHLEIHLDGGGWSGRVPRPPWGVDRSMEEIALGFPALPERRAAIRRRLTELRRERARADEQAYFRYLTELLAYEEEKRTAGSRFNLRFRRAIELAQLTPEAVRDALRPYLDFVAVERLAR